LRIKLFKMTYAPEVAKAEDVAPHSEKAAVKYPWWVQSYSIFLYVTFFIFFILVVVVSYYFFKGDWGWIALQWLTVSTTYGYVLDQCSLLLCYLKGRTPIARPGLELLFMCITPLASCAACISSSPIIFLCLVILRDGYALLCWELARVSESVDVQENDLRIYDTVTPYLKKPFDAILVLLNIPFQDALAIWLSIYLGFVLPLKELQLSLILLMPLKHFISDLVNDAFYYYLHTSLHTPRWYSHHKMHHLVKHPTAWCAGIMDWREMCETFLLTRILTPILMYFVFGPWNIPEFLLYNAYLGILEIGGHTGCVGGNSVLFRTGTSIFMVPLGIQLEIGHHDLHHELFNVNFGKRCSLYDKMFGTYMDAQLKVPSFEGGSKTIRKKGRSPFKFFLFHK